MTVKTKILFDVDGVFNALPYPSTDLELQTGWSNESFVVNEIMGYMITTSSELVDRVNAIAALPNVEPMWLTTWCQDAPEQLAPKIGLNAQDWPVLGTKSDVLGRSFMWWKFDEVKKLAERWDGPIIWIDDDMSYYYNQFSGWHAKRRELVTTQLICPETFRGLTLNEWESVEALVV